MGGDQLRLEVHFSPPSLVFRAGTSRLVYITSRSTRLFKSVSLIIGEYAGLNCIQLLPF
jgi:hypothetical protein